MGDGETAARRAREGEFDLILLDVMLPRKDGFEVCRELRRAGSDADHPADRPRQEAEKVMGLELGRRRLRHQALQPPELRARIKAVLRRTAGDEEPIYRFGDAEVDFARCELRRAGRRSRSTRSSSSCSPPSSATAGGSSAASSCSTRSGARAPSSPIASWTTTS